MQVYEANAHRSMMVRVYGGRVISVSSRNEFSYKCTVYNSCIKADDRKTSWHINHLVNS